MRLRNPFDDGGTPGWRARIMEHGQTPWQRWYRQASPLDVLVFAIVASLAAGAAIFFGGLALLVAWHYLHTA